MKCPNPKCGSERVIRNGVRRHLVDSQLVVAQSYRCNACGHTFTNTESPGMKHSLAMVSMASHLLRAGLSTRDVAVRLEALGYPRVSHKTVSIWAKEHGGIRFRGRRRLKGCSFCGSKTAHGKGCPLLKEHPRVTSHAPSIGDSVA